MAVSVPVSATVNEVEKSVPVCATLLGFIERDFAITLRTRAGTGSYYKTEFFNCC